MKTFPLLAAFFPLLAFVPVSLAHHEGSIPQLPPETVQTPDLTILWIIGGVVLGSIGLFLLVNVFSSKSHLK